jgi:hypothetical protein
MGFCRREKNQFERREREIYAEVAEKKIQNLAVSFLRLLRDLRVLCVQGIGI